MTGCPEVITQKNELYGSSYTVFAQSKCNFFHSLIILLWTVNKDIVWDL